MSRDPLWQSPAIRGAILAACGLLATGAAAVVREHGNDIQDLKTAKAVQAVRDQAILADLAAIKAKLGIVP